MTEEKAFQQRDFTPDTQTCITGYNVLGNLLLSVCSICQYVSELAVHALSILHSINDSHRITIQRTSYNAFSNYLVHIELF